MGFFRDQIDIADITHEASKSSLGFHQLADEINGGDTLIPTGTLVIYGLAFIDFHKKFDLHLVAKSRGEREGALRFLAALSSYYFGRNGDEWDWKNIRRQSRDLYQQLERDSSAFTNKYGAHIEQAMREVTEFIRINR